MQYLLLNEHEERSYSLLERASMLKRFCHKCTRFIDRDLVTDETLSGYKTIK